jgi:hypothetical protein
MADIGATVTLMSSPSAMSLVLERGGPSCTLLLAEVVTGGASTIWCRWCAPNRAISSPTIATQHPALVKARYQWLRVQSRAIRSSGQRRRRPRSEALGCVRCEPQNPGSLNGAARTLREPEAEDGGRDDDDRCSKQAGVDEGFDGQCNGTAGCGGGVK